jgi:hypothetical protein
MWGKKKRLSVKKHFFIGVFALGEVRALSEEWGSGTFFFLQSNK